LSRADRLLILSPGAARLIRCRCGALVLATLVVSEGCAEVLEIPDDPELSPGSWSCLSRTSALSLLPAPVTSRALVRVQACDFVRGCDTKVTGLSARVCQKQSLACSDPVALDLADEAGLFTFDVPTGTDGFDGYIDVSSETELCTNPAFGADALALCALAAGCEPAQPDDRCRIPLYAHALLFFNPPITHDSVEPLTLPLIPLAALPAWARTAGATLDPSKGNLLISASDCRGDPAAGVTYQIDNDPENVAELYVRDGEPSTAPETDASGVGAFLGVSEGSAEVSAYNAAHLRVGTVALRAAPFTVTYGALAPAWLGAP
jgi:hypothetical protein